MIPRPAGVPSVLHFPTSHLLLIGTSSGILLSMSPLTGEIYSYAFHAPTFLTSTLDTGDDEGGDFNVEGKPLNQIITPNTIYSIETNQSRDFAATTSENGTAVVTRLRDMKKLSTMICRSDVKDDDLDAQEFADEDDERWFNERLFLHSFYLKLGVRAATFIEPIKHECDGTFLISGGEACTMDVWDVSDLCGNDSSGGDGDGDGDDDKNGVNMVNPVIRYKTHSGWINVLKTLPNTDSYNNVFISGDVLGKVIIFKLEVSRNKKKFALNCLWGQRCHVSMVSNISLNLDFGKVVLCTGGVDGKVAVWDVTRFCSGSGFSFKDGDESGAIEDAMGAAKGWEVKNGIRLGGHSGGVKDCGISVKIARSDVMEFEDTQDNKDHVVSTIISAGSDRNCLLFHLESKVESVVKLCNHGRSEWAVTKRDTVRGVGFSQSYKYVATFGIGCDVMIWEAESGHLVCNLVAHQRAVKSICFGGEGENEVAIVSGDEEGKTILWRLKKDTEEGEGGHFSHPSEEEIISWHHHRVPIRSVRFCGGTDRVVSSDATGKVIIVDVETQEMLVEFLGGEVSCSAWNFWSRRAGGVYLVTTSLSKMVIWDCDSGKVAANRLVEEEWGGYVEGYDILTVGSSVSIVCCTDKGKVLLWTPETIDVKPEDDSDGENEYNPNLDEGGNGTLVDLTELVTEFDLKSSFRGVSFGADLSIIAWGLRKAFVWERTEEQQGAGEGAYVYGGEFEGGEGIYGISYAAGVRKGVVQCILEDGWVFQLRKETSISG
ncbi:hypothetical protein TrVE_jg8907 [Triparma verrucosa]|uniref:Uncharacterized protein n=1 Tax=Triparma verrucosa TaxID=1606542 RepID=A0A9W7EVH0_9STRA|nr:hypothetical protein TrVE_jg8907 [Triparma verrucosa]